jgi:ABC-2 type transport system ATP-binding protein
LNGRIASCVFQVDTEELDRVMKYVSQYGIVKLESAPPTLEDLFMRHHWCCIN